MTSGTFLHCVLARTHKGHDGLCAHVVKSMPEHQKKINPGSINITLKGVAQISWECFALGQPSCFTEQATQRGSYRAAKSKLIKVREAARVAQMWHC